MSRVTTYTCDRCGNDALTMGQLHLVEIRAASVHKRIDLCRPCMVKLGIFPSRDNDPPLPEPMPTTLDLLVQLAELVKDEM